MFPNAVIVDKIGKPAHCSQVMAGLELLRQNGEVELRSENVSFDPSAFVSIRYKDRRIVFDMLDGYIDLVKARKYLQECDYYFKRSFSAVENTRHFGNFQAKIHPLGMNYMVTVPGSLFVPKEKEMLGWKGMIRRALGSRQSSYFTPDKFEEKPVFKNSEDLRILFLARLWRPSEGATPEQIRYLDDLNAMRISLIRKLRAKFGRQFCGGLNLSPCSVCKAPDCIVSYLTTCRVHYLNILHKHDICIATSGLWKSIGWKMAEYVAASKAIISEPLNYEVPGGFARGKNYLEFFSVDEAIARVEELIMNPNAVLNMKMRNKEYYEKWLRPDVLVRQALSVVDGE